MKKLVVLLLLITICVGSVFAQATVTIQDAPEGLSDIFKRILNLLFYVGVVIGVISVMILAISAMLGITVNEKVKTTLLRVFLFMGVLVIATGIPKWLMARDAGIGGQGGALIKVETQKTQYINPLAGNTEDIKEAQ